MKAIIIELRLYIAEKLMAWAFDIAPEKDFRGMGIRNHIMKYFGG